MNYNLKNGKVLTPKTEGEKNMLRDPKQTTAAFKWHYPSIHHDKTMKAPS
jgi:hypothetical protein